MSQYFKFPKIYHLPWSRGTTSDDKFLGSVEPFVGKEIVVSEKGDGENTSLYNDYYHARSLDSKNHPSRNPVKAIWGGVRQYIPPGWRVVGENLYARHSIHYHALPTFFLVFAVFDDHNTCLSWDETVFWAELLDLKTVPVLYRGPWDEEKIRSCWTGQSAISPGDEQEGYVVRMTGAFSYDCYAECVGKFVREGHVQTDAHWQTTWVPNSCFTTG